MLRRSRSRYGKVEQIIIQGGKKNLKKLGGKWNNVILRPVQYAPILQASEDKLWAAILKNFKNELHALGLRQFLPCALIFEIEN